MTNCWTPTECGTDIYGRYERLAASHARLTEQVRVARDGLERAKAQLSADWPPRTDVTLARVIVRETITRMEKNDDSV
jgi:hypothetical protein